MPPRRTSRNIVAFAALAALAVAAPVVLAAQGDITTIAGNGTPGAAGDGGPAASAELATPVGVTATAGGGYLIAQQGSPRVRRVAPDGTITTVAGSGTAGFGGDTGPATAALFNAPSAVAVAADGALLISDSNNNRVRRVAPDGTITTVAGSGDPTFNGDGLLATQSSLAFPVGLAVLADGGYLVVDNDHQRVRRVSPGAVMTTVAGTGALGSGGDGGPATSAQLNEPAGVAVLADGGFVVAELGGHRVRRVAPDGTITTVAGTGVAGFTGDGGPATSAQFNGPSAVAAAGGGFVVTEQGGHRVRRVSADGTITTIAGIGLPGFGGDFGAAAGAQLNLPLGVSVAADGDVLIADTSNHRVRSIEGPPAPPPAPPPPPPPPQQPLADKDKDGIPDAQDTSDASVGPTLAKTAIAKVTNGLVYVLRPKARARATRQVTFPLPPGAVPLKGAEVVPLGSIIYTEKGRVSLTTESATRVRGRSRRTQRSSFFDGVFQLRQRRAKQPVTELTLRSPTFAKACPSTATAARAAASRSKKVVSRLWGSGTGRFRTRGRNSTATVRGTIWLTEERCDGTLTRVKRGSVTVRDLRLNRTIVVRAGKSHLARASRVAAKSRRP